MSELWIFTILAQNSDNRVLIDWTKYMIFPLCSNVAMLFGLYRVLINVIELKQGFQRIIDLDCDDYNIKYNLKKVQKK